MKGDAQESANLPLVCDARYAWSGIAVQAIVFRRMITVTYSNPFSRDRLFLKSVKPGFLFYLRLSLYKNRWLAGGHSFLFVKPSLWRFTSFNLPNLRRNF